MIKFGCKQIDCPPNISYGPLKQVGVPICLCKVNFYTDEHV